MPAEATSKARSALMNKQQKKELPDDVRANRDFYDPLWRSAKLIPPERFNTWPLIKRLTADNAPRLEVAPGLRPRLPLQATQFVDISEPAVSVLRQNGAD